MSLIACADVSRLSLLIDLDERFKYINACNNQYSEKLGKKISEEPTIIFINEEDKI